MIWQYIVFTVIFTTSTAFIAQMNNDVIISVCGVITIHNVASYFTQINSDQNPNSFEI